MTATKPTKGTATKDSFVNFQMKLGVGSVAGVNPLNQISAGYYQYNPITRLRTVLDFAYRGSWIVRRAVDSVAEDMTREGIEFESSLDPALHEAIEEQETELQIWHSLEKVLKWGRLYGGCLGFLMIDGQDPSTPLQVDRVGKGQFKGIFVLDRWMVTPSLQDPITDFGPNIGLPKFYQVNTDANGIPMMNIHHSRVIRITGDELPYYMKQSENMWGASVIESLWDRLISFDSVTMGTAQLVFKAHLRTLKLPNFRELVAEGGEAMTQVMAFIETVRALQANEGLTVLDQDDVLEYNSYAFSGLSDVMLQFAQQISGALQIPLIRLFSQTPTGFNSTGDVDLRMYYDMCKAQQMSKLKPNLIVMYAVLHRSLTGKPLPKGFKFNFRPLWQLTDTDKSSIGKTDSDDVLAVHQDGLISDQLALKELRERGHSTGRWQSITDEDIAAASDELAPPVELGEFGKESGAQPGEAGSAQGGKAEGEVPPAVKTNQTKPEPPAKTKTAGAA